MYIIYLYILYIECLKTQTLKTKRSISDQSKNICRSFRKRFRLSSHDVKIEKVKIEAKNITQCPLYFSKLSPRVLFLSYLTLNVVNSYMNNWDLECAPSQCEDSGWGAGKTKAAGGRGRKAEYFPLQRFALGWWPPFISSRYCIYVKIS